MCRGTGGTDDYARARIRAVAVRRRRFTAGTVINDLFMGGDITPGCKSVNAIKACDQGLRPRLATSFGAQAFAA
jgi:hypothetical protein